jgi:hypothetical protein
MERPAAQVTPTDPGANGWLAQLLRTAGERVRPLPGPGDGEAEPGSKDTDRLLRDARAEVLVAGLNERTRGRRTAVLSGAPLVWPGDGTLVAWLRRLTARPLYTAAFEEMASRRWLGLDPFALRDLPAPPPFLVGVDVLALPAEQVAPFLRRISLTRPPPTPQELAPAALRRSAGKVSVARRTAASRRWGQTDAPPLPHWTRIPHVVHGIWLGRPMPGSSVFWRNYAEGARRYAGRVDFVVWTDLPRSWFAQVAAHPEPEPGPDPLAGARALYSWAVENDISLVSVSEVFSAAAPMSLHASYTLEMCKQLPRGYAAASDGLRVEIVHRFGGLYADGDMSFEPPTEPPTLDAGVPDGPPSRSGWWGVRGFRPVTDGAWQPEELPAFFDRLATSVPGFAMNPHPDGRVGADVIAAPAGHPALALWRECARLNYLIGQPQMFGGVQVMSAAYVGFPWQEHRYLVPHRSGRVHLFVLRLLKLPPQHLVSTKRTIRDGRELSWLPPEGGELAPAAPTTQAQVLAVLARCLTFLQWQLLAREGNLYLSAIEPVIEGLPDADAAWLAVLRVLPSLFGTPVVTSVTDVRRNDDGTVTRVRLPPEAEALLDRAASPAGWLGAPVSAKGEAVWLLDEVVAPCTLRRWP